MKLLQKNFKIISNICKPQLLSYYYYQLHDIMYEVPDKTQNFIVLVKNFHKQVIFSSRIQTF